MNVSITANSMDDFEKCEKVLKSLPRQLVDSCLEAKLMNGCFIKMSFDRAAIGRFSELPTPSNIKLEKEGKDEYFMKTESRYKIDDLDMVIMAIFPLGNSPCFKIVI